MTTVDFTFPDAIRSQGLPHRCGRLGARQAVSRHGVCEHVLHSKSQVRHLQLLQLLVRRAFAALIQCVALIRGSGTGPWTDGRWDHPLGSSVGIIRCVELHLSNRRQFLRM